MKRTYQLPDLGKTQENIRFFCVLLICVTFDLFVAQQPHIDYFGTLRNWLLFALGLGVTALVLSWIWGTLAEKNKARLLLGTPIFFAVIAINLGQPGSQVIWDCIKLYCALSAALIYCDWHASKNSPALAVAQLQALQARIRPHFFFNSITAIVMMMKKDAKKAEEALLDLADIFRETMKQSSSLVKVEDEFDLAQKYLKIEKLRFGDRLELTIMFDANAKNAIVPHLILQPLVENAVVHGIERASRGTISMRAFSAAGKLNIIVENSLPKECSVTQNPRKGNQIALDNIKQRLVLHYGTDAELSCSSKDGKWRARIVLPFRALKNPPSV